jgi:hypothetical protein
MKNHTFIHAASSGRPCSVRDAHRMRRRRRRRRRPAPPPPEPAGHHADPSTTDLADGRRPTDPLDDPDDGPDGRPRRRPPTTTTTTTITTTRRPPTPTDDHRRDPGFVFADDPTSTTTRRSTGTARSRPGRPASARLEGLGFNGEDISIRDAYNASNPEEDAAMMWFGEIAESVMFFHDNLDDDLMGLGSCPRPSTRPSRRRARSSSRTRSSTIPRRRPGTRTVARSGSGRRHHARGRPAQARADAAADVRSRSCRSTRPRTTCRSRRSSRTWRRRTCK